MKRTLWIGVAAATAGGALGGAVYWLARRSRAFVEKAPYLIRRQDGPFEVREYPTFSVASASTRGDQRRGAFQQLFRFIERANTRSEKIAMTAPVFIEPDAGTMSFVMPVDVETRGVPAPIDAAVTVHERPGGFVAVYRFAGRPTEENERRAAATLRQWMTAEDLEPAGHPPIIAYYDAPWIPGPLRRNEVMLRLGGAFPRPGRGAGQNSAAAAFATT